MRILVLVQHYMLPLPKDLAAVTNFGRETIVVDHPHKRVEQHVSGDSMVIHGKPEAFARWLAPFPEVWTTYNPVAGRWTALPVVQQLDRPVDWRDTPRPTMDELDESGAWWRGLTTDERAKHVQDGGIQPGMTAVSRYYHHVVKPATAKE